MSQDRQKIEEDLIRIQELKRKISSSAISASRKKELLERLSRLQPSEHGEFCGCNSCSSGYTANPDETFFDQAIAEVESNFIHSIIPPRLMNWRPFPILIIGAGIALMVIGIRMMRNQNSSTPEAE